VVVVVVTLQYLFWNRLESKSTMMYVQVASSVDVDGGGGGGGSCDHRFRWIVVLGLAGSACDDGATAVSSSMHPMAMVLPTTTTTTTTTSSTQS
jgi:hypothetical protein